MCQTCNYPCGGELRHYLTKLGRCHERTALYPSGHCCATYWSLLQLTFFELQWLNMRHHDASQSILTKSLFFFLRDVWNCSSFFFQFIWRILLIINGKQNKPTSSLTIPQFHIEAPKSRNNFYMYAISLSIFLTVNWVKTDVTIIWGKIYQSYFQ